MKADSGCPEEEIEVFEYRILNDGGIKITELRGPKVKLSEHRDMTILRRMDGGLHRRTDAKDIFSLDQKRSVFYFPDNDEGNIETIKNLYDKKAADMEAQAKKARSFADSIHVVS